MVVGQVYIGVWFTVARPDFNREYRQSYFINPFLNNIIAIELILLRCICNQFFTRYKTNLGKMCCIYLDKDI